MNKRKVELLSYQDLLDKCKKLKEYADLDGTELGEVSEKLCELASYGDYVSEEFKSSLQQEILRLLSEFTENTRIVEKTETYTRNCAYLVWYENE